MPPRAGSVRPSPPFFFGWQQQHPEAEGSTDSAAAVRAAAATSDLTAGAASLSPPPPPGPASPVGAGAPGVRARVPARVCAPEPFSDPRSRPAQDRPGITARAPRPTSPADGRPAGHPAVLCKKMAGSVADSDAVVVSVAGCTGGAPFPPSRTLCRLLQLSCGGEELRPSPAPPRGKAPGYLLAGATVHGRLGGGREAGRVPRGGRVPLARGTVFGADGGVGVTESPLRAVRPPARCVHVARVRVRVLGRAPRVRPRRPGDSPLEMGPHRRLQREVERGRSTSATSRRTGLGDSGSRSVYGWRGACPPMSRGSGSPVCLDLDFDLDLTSLGIFRGLAPGYKGRVLFQRFLDWEAAASADTACILLDFARFV